MAVPKGWQQFLREHPSKLGLCQLKLSIYDAVGQWLSVQKLSHKLMFLHVVVLNHVGMPSETSPNIPFCSEQFFEFPFFFFLFLILDFLLLPFIYYILFGLFLSLNIQLAFGLWWNFFLLQKFDSDLFTALKPTLEYVKLVLNAYDFVVGYYAGDLISVPNNLEFNGIICFAGTASFFGCGVNHHHDFI